MDNDLKDEQEPHNGVCSSQVPSVSTEPAGAADEAKASAVTMVPDQKEHPDGQEPTATPADVTQPAMEALREDGQIGSPFQYSDEQAAPALLGAETGMVSSAVSVTSSTAHDGPVGVHLDMETLKADIAAIDDPAELVSLVLQAAASIQPLVATLQNQVTTLSEDKRQLQRDLDSAADRLVHWNEEVSRLAGENKVLQDEVEQRRQEVTELARSLQSAKSDLASSRADKKTVDRSRDKALRDLRDMDERRRKAEEGFSSAQKMNIQLRDDLKQAQQQAGEASRWQMAKAVAPVLSKLSELAGMEPIQTKGLSPRTVLEQMQGRLSDELGAKLQPFPDPRELNDGRIWLDADVSGLEKLTARYNWPGERPFEGLPAGNQHRRFRLVRRGWLVRHEVLLPAQVSAEPAGETVVVGDATPDHPAGT